MGTPTNTPDTGEIVQQPVYNAVRELVDALKFTSEQRSNDYGGNNDAIPSFLRELSKFAVGNDLRLDMFKTIFIEGRSYLPRQDQLEVIAAMVDIENLTNNIQYDPFLKGMVIKGSSSLEETNKYIKDGILARWPNATVIEIPVKEGEMKKTGIVTPTKFTGITAEITFCDDIRFYTYPPMLPKIAGIVFTFSEEGKTKFREDLSKYIKERSPKSESRDKSTSNESFKFEDRQSLIKDVFEVTDKDLLEISSLEDLESLLKARYRKLSFRYHPDSTEPTRDEVKFRNLNEANEKLIKKGKLRNYVLGNDV